MWFPIIVIAWGGFWAMSAQSALPAAPAITTQNEDLVVGNWTDGEVRLTVWKDEESYLGRIESCAQGPEYAEKMYSWRIGEAAFEVVYKEVRDGALVYRGVTRDWNPEAGSHELRTGFEILLKESDRGLELAITRGGDVIYFKPAGEAER
jgi:hypothetical protein